MTFYFPFVDYRWNEWKYTNSEVAQIVDSLWEICRIVERQLSPLVDMSQVLKDLKIEFVSEKTEELRKYRALGISYPNRNTNLIPTGFSRQELTARTGIVSMELCHSLIARITKDSKMSNDLIHWLYNEGYLKVHEYRTAGIIKNYGSALRVVVPDMAYGWQNRKEIMEGIRSGKYREATHKYWSDPTWNDETEPILATEHELELIREFLSR